jgi:hypothetical protein
MTLDLRVARLEAAEAIRNLKARYCELCDAGYRAEELAELFVEDAHGNWRFTRVALSTRFLAPYERGWGTSRTSLD